jgi:hypothetical protein
MTQPYGTYEVEETTGQLPGGPYPLPLSCSQRLPSNN